MIRRRFSASLAALAVVAAGLAWGAAPASAAVTNASVTPGTLDATWDVGASPAATLTYTTDATVAEPSVVVEWDWPVSYGTRTTDTASNTADPKTYVCANTGITFTTSGTWSTAGTVSCSYLQGGSGDPSRHRVQLENATAPIGTVSVFFPADTVTSTASARGYGIWTIGADTTSLLQVRVYTTQVGGNPLPLITLNIDGNGGRCSTQSVTGFQSTWATAPDASNCTRPGFVFTGYNTSANGSGIAIAPGGNLHLTGDNTLYAQWVQPRVAAAPTNVVAAGGLKSVKVSWTAPVDIGFSPISAYLVQATPGGATCVTNQASANLLECTYSNLTPGTQYTFRVQALNRAGWGEFSAASNAAAPYDILLDTISRPEVKLLFISRGSNLDAEGRAPGLREGTTLTPMMKVGADGTFVAQTGNLARVDAKGRYSWSRKLDAKQNGQPVSLYFMLGDAKTTTLTAKLGATVGLPSPPRDVKVTSTTDGITVSWKAPAKDGGSPITGYEMTSDLRAPSAARSKFVSCKVAAPTTTCTMNAGATLFDPNKTYTFSVVAKTERGTSREATEQWKGQIYRLNIFKRARVDSEVLLSFTAFGWEKANPTFEIQAKVGESGPWVKQGTARLDPDYVDPIADWAGMLPKSVTAGSTVFYRVKSNKGYSNEVRFRLSSSFEYSFG